MWVGFSVQHPRREDNERVPTTMINTVMDMDTDTILRATRRPPKIGKREGEEKEEEDTTNHHRSIGLAVSWHYHCWFGVAFKSLRRSIYNRNRYGLSISRNRRSTDIIILVVIPIVRIVMVIRIMAIRIHIHIHIDLHTRIDLHRIKRKIPPRKKKCCNLVVNSIQNGKAPTRIRNYCRAK